MVKMVFFMPFEDTEGILNIEQGTDEQGMLNG